MIIANTSRSGKTENSKGTQLETQSHQVIHLAVFYEIHLVVKGESTIKQSIKLTVDFYNEIKHSSEVGG